MSGVPAGAGQLLGKRLGKFEIVALLALGGTAEIYLARIGGAAGFEKYVVVKCLHDHLADDVEFVKMFLDEARLAAHLDHSNIVQTMELGEHDGRYYMVMEFLAGLSLAMIIRRVTERLPSGRVPVPLVLNILAQSAAGLHYAHEKAMNGKALNIVHRDISPQNLVISFEGVVKLVDFGIAKAEMRETRTRSGTIKGKFAYMSPEQCVANNVDRRTDVFALGVIGHELLTGRRLFKRPSPYETYQAVMECDVKPPSSIDAELDPVLDRVIMGAITKDRAERYPTAEAFGDTLLGYLHHRGIGSSPGDVSRFFDAYFGQELEEHSARMRELIGGRDLSVDTGVNWGGNAIDAEDDAPRVADQLSSATDSAASRRPSIPSFALVHDDLGPGSRGELDDEMPAERTRIESNPLARFNEMERAAGRGLSHPDGPTVLAPSDAVPVPAPPPLESLAAAASPPTGPASGRFPDLANLPTVVAGAEPLAILSPPPSPSPMARPGQPPAAGPSALTAANAKTRVVALASPSGMPVSGAAAGPADAPSAAASGAVSGAASHASNGGLPGMPPPASNGGLPGMPPPRGAPLRPHSSSASPGPGPRHQPGPGYPVLNAELSAQIATGATVFPSEPPRGSAPHVGGPSSAPGAAMSGAPTSGPAASTLPGSGAPLPIGLPGQVNPLGATLPAGSAGLPGTPGPRGSESLPTGYPMASGAMFDPQRAADLMSPVGQQYGERVDWEGAAAGRARAVPPWLLAALFVGAIGIALALTIVVARLIH
jgi:serine/threonine-protein kinase